MKVLIVLCALVAASLANPGYLSGAHGVLAAPGLLAAHGVIAAPGIAVVGSDAGRVAAQNAVAQAQGAAAAAQGLEAAARGAGIIHAQTVLGAHGLLGPAVHLAAPADVAAAHLSAKAAILG